MDVLSDVLLSVRLTGAVFFDVDAHAPFATESPGFFYGVWCFPAPNT